MQRGGWKYGLKGIWPINRFAVDTNLFSPSKIYKSNMREENDQGNSTEIADFEITGIQQESSQAHNEVLPVQDINEELQQENSCPSSSKNYATNESPPNKKSNESEHPV